MSSDLTFITNEPENNLLERFKKLIKHTDKFDILVGYFFITGFHELYKSLQTTEKIRILIGISTNRQTFELIQESYEEQMQMEFSQAQTKELLVEKTAKEFETSPDKSEIEVGVEKFKEWLISDKLEIRIYPNDNIHAKLYIMTFKEDLPDKGRIITGSSNFTKGGLTDNLEFNVQLERNSDYIFALDKFNELWQGGIDAKDIYLESIQNSWTNKEITPYELYLKFLYEYFKERINKDKYSIRKEDVPENFISYDFQTEAVFDAKDKLEQYGGVFLSDVVGLGKTYMAALLAKQLDGRTLVIAPPVLIDEENPGSWTNIFREFNINADCKSVGKLDSILNHGVRSYKNIIIDEAHRFRTETNQTYENIARICRGKRIILVSATPLNNKPEDILAQIKLFQKSKKSTIPNLPDLDKFFKRLSKKLEGLNRQDDYEEYMEITKDNAKQIREKVLKYLMVRRTRNEIVKYFEDDIKKQKLRFPDVADPEPVFYEFSDEENEIFDNTIEYITKDFTYSRYTPLLYYSGKITQPEEISQRNMGKFMKILLIKRLESSFHAFRKSVERFIHSYERFIDEFNNGFVWVSKKYSNKVFDLLEQDNDEALQKLIDEDKVRQYNASDFKPEFIQDLNNDLNVLKNVLKLWKNIKRDPKLLKFIDILKTDNILKKNKLIIFSESKETVDYLVRKLKDSGIDKILAFSGSSGRATRRTIIENFDANSKSKKDDYRLLITTEVLSEGISLHRSNCVINYDIPWNPTRIMQRVGRVNRVNTPFKKIYTFNFFPTQQSNDLINLKEAAEAKIQSFIEMLGTDARLLTDGEEIKSHDLFNMLNSKKTITGEDDEESELKYLQVIRDIRDNDVDLFEKIKKLPKKARSAKLSEIEKNSVLSFFRKGKLLKFFITNGSEPEELDFMTSASMFECEPETKRDIERRDYFDLLNKNKKKFKIATTEEKRIFAKKGGREQSQYILSILSLKEFKNFRKFTDEDDEFIKTVIEILKEGALPKQTSKTLANKIKTSVKKGFDALNILGILRTGIPNEFFQETYAESAADTTGAREVILSEYLVAENNNE